MSDVFEVLKEDHEEVRRMMAELEDGLTATTGADGEELAARKRRIQQLIIEESKHEAVEEEYLWPAVRERVPAGDRLAREGIGQEQDAKQILDRLDKYGPATAGYEELLARFIQDAREHMAFEESRVWPELRKALSEREAVELGQRIEHAKRTAPTRPHPGTPPKPGVLKTTAAAVGLADRLRDALTGRGKS
jgi:hemerythrin superfamily protein